MPIHLRCRRAMAVVVVPSRPPLRRHDVEELVEQVACRPVDQRQETDTRQTHSHRAEAHEAREGGGKLRPAAQDGGRTDHTLLDDERRQGEGQQGVEGEAVRHRRG